MTLFQTLRLIESLKSDEKVWDMLADGEWSSIEGSVTVSFEEWSDFHQANKFLDWIQAFLAYKKIGSTIEFQCVSKDPDPNIPLDPQTVSDRFGSIFAAIGRVE